MLIETIGRRFDQPGYKAYQCLENLLVNAANCIDYIDDLKRVVGIYGADIHEANLKVQLQTFSVNVKEKMSNIFDVRKYLAQLTTAKKALLNEVINIMKLVMVMPATNSLSERSFSTMCRIKSYDPQ